MFNILKDRRPQHTGCLISIWTILWDFFEVTGWFKIKEFNFREKFMQLPLKVNKKIFFVTSSMASQWPPTFKN